MSSCVGLLPAPDDYLEINPSMVHSLSNVMDPWLIQSGHVSLARTCSIMVPQTNPFQGIKPVQNHEPFPRKKPGSIVVSHTIADQTESVSTVTSRFSISSLGLSR
ncbi:hypothetical protein PIB30_056805 [Stylosanthes scabra]|uniref:Uncharacterized protein n=1 Tax=Stylosanthes scabra TaxID=79078 RepID=A0ABU6SKR1_9FABA|nr:hypothetical protein [Stylosanthes scabra]